MSEYTPTTEEVRDKWASCVEEFGTSRGMHLDYDDALAAFDRWLAALICEAKAEALTEAVAMVSDEEHAFVDKIRGTVVPKLTIIKALRARAEAYRKEKNDD